MQNFGKIKNIFNSLLAEAMVSKNSKKKKMFKEYVRAIKGNEILKAQFLVYNNIEGKVETNEHKVTEFVKANIEVLKKYTKDEIYEANMKLAEPILLEQKLPEYDNKIAKLHEDISTLVFTKKDANTVDKIVNALVGVTDYIKENKIKESTGETNFPTSILANIAVDKFNDRYSNLSEDEKSVLKTILESNDDDKEKMFNVLSRECIDLVNTNLTESDTNTKEKLLQVKDRLLRLEYTKQSFISDISKLVELKSDLNE